MAVCERCGCWLAAEPLRMIFELSVQHLRDTRRDGARVLDALVYADLAITRSLAMDRGGADASPSFRVFNPGRRAEVSSSGDTSPVGPELSKLPLCACA